MFTLFQHNNILYYGSNGITAENFGKADQPNGCVWFWKDAPESIKKEYKESHPDFFANAPYGVIKEWIDNHIIKLGIKL
jgi:hypothetical protein